MDGLDEGCRNGGRARVLGTPEDRIERGERGSSIGRETGPDEPRLGGNAGLVMKSHARNGVAQRARSGSVVLGRRRASARINGDLEFAEPWPRRMVIFAMEVASQRGALGEESHQEDRSDLSRSHRHAETIPNLTLQ